MIDGPAGHGYSGQGDGDDNDSDGCGLVALDEPGADQTRRRTEKPSTRQPLLQSTHHSTRVDTN